MKIAIVRISNNGVTVIKRQEAGNSRNAFEAFKKYIINAEKDENPTPMDDYVFWQYVKFELKKDMDEMQLRIDWLERNGRICEISLKGNCAIELRIEER